MQKIAKDSADLFANIRPKKHYSDNTHHSHNTGQCKKRLLKNIGEIELIVGADSCCLLYLTIQPLFTLILY